MSLDSFLIEVLRDPIDGGELYYSEVDAVLYNPRRQVIYEVKGAIPVLLPEEARPLTSEEATRFTKVDNFVVTGTVTN